MTNWPKFMDGKSRRDNVIHIAPQTTLDDRALAVERAQDRVKQAHDAFESAQAELLDALKLLRDDINSRELGVKAVIEP